MKTTEVRIAALASGEGSVRESKSCCFAGRTHVVTAALLLLCFRGCSQHRDVEDTAPSPGHDREKMLMGAAPEILNPAGTTIETRILPPPGYRRPRSSSKSFEYYLRRLPLKPHGAEVLLHNGEAKPNGGVYAAVVDLPIGTRDLHQCADAVMRLRAEYLWQQKRYDEIRFNFTNGFRVDYRQWRRGRRITVKGNETHWTRAGDPSNTLRDFRDYLEIVFTYAGSLSLSRELEPVEVEDMKTGDVFIRGGLPGHAIIVVDMAVHTGTQSKVFLVAQSYMPAQEIHVLENPYPQSRGISPWYPLEFGDTLNTPEWVFSRDELKRFEQERNRSHEASE